jgi:hypothetical protein
LRQPEVGGTLHREKQAYVSVLLTELSRYLNE